MTTYHVAVDGQVGHYPALASESDAVWRGYTEARETGQSVSILRADGDLADGAEVKWTRLAVLTGFEAS